MTNIQSPPARFIAVEYLKRVAKKADKDNDGASFVELGAYRRELEQKIQEMDINASNFNEKLDELYALKTLQNNFNKFAYDPSLNSSLRITEGKITKWDANKDMKLTKSELGIDENDTFVGRYF